MADLDRRLLAEGKFDFDVVGHYARPDIFQLLVNDQPRDGWPVEPDSASASTADGSEDVGRGGDAT